MPESYLCLIFVFVVVVVFCCFFCFVFCCCFSFAFVSSNTRKFLTQTAPLNVHICGAKCSLSKTRVIAEQGCVGVTVSWQVLQRAGYAVQVCKCKHLGFSEDVLHPHRLKISFMLLKR